MILNRLESIYNWINKLNPNIKTLIIIILGLAVLQINYSQTVKEILKEHQKDIDTEKSIAEDYTITIASELNGYVEDILEHDQSATNVILLNYHNNVTSTNGLSYRFFTALTEKKRGFETRSCIKIWTELAYINYEDEVRKINRNGYLELNKISDGYQNFPKLSELFIASGAKSAGIYPIMGIEGPIGMIVVLYNQQMKHSPDYYRKAIAPYIQPIGILLDYNSVKKNLK